MSHPLESKIGGLRSRLRGWIAVYGLGCWLTYGMGAVLFCALADYLIRFHDPGIRVLATLSVAAVLGWAAYRYLYRPWTVRLRDVDLARRVQARFPSLGDDLASAVEFLAQADNDPTAGSLALRQAIVARATGATEGLDLRAVVRPRPAWLAGLAAAAAGLVAGLLVAMDPGSARIALARLTRPWADLPWPQVHHLVVRNPVERLARGQPFEAEVIDAEGVRLPAEVRILYRSQNPDGAVSEDGESMHLVQGMMVARRERVTHSFSFRVEGGDDHSMRWRPVEVVDPPAIASLRVTVTPPAYTGWPQEPFEGNIRALAGSRAEIVATATKPLSAAAMLLGGPETARIARLSADGHQLTVPADSGSPWVLEKSGGYGFRLTDREGITDGDVARWEIRVVPDAPPAVAVEEPGPSESLLVTPQAVVPLTVTASDDLAIKSIDLQFTRSDRPADAPAKRSLYVGPTQPKLARGLPAALENGKGDRQTVRHAWKFDELNLPPGAQVTFWAEAADYKPQTTKSEPRRLSVVTPEDFSHRLSSREAAILADLSRALESQRRGRRQVAAIEKHAVELPRLDQLDVDQLRGAELNQRQIDEMLASRSEGVPKQVLGLLADVANNKLDQPRLRQRMEKLLARLERLAADELPAASRDLTAAIKAAQASLDEPDAKPSAASVQKSAAAAGKHQDAIITALEQMTEELIEWDRFRGFPQELSQLAREQEALAARTGELARRTLTKQLKDLAPGDAAELAEAARQQGAIAGRFDATEQAMEEAVARTPPGEPAAANVAEGLRRARELDLAGDMRSAGQRIQDNQLGQATQQQGRIQEGLRDVLDRLSGRGPRESGQPSAAQGEPSVKNIREMQMEVNRRTEELEKTSGRSDKSTPEARRRYEALGGEQRQLGELLGKMFPPPSGAVQGEQKPATPLPGTPPGPSTGPVQAPDPRPSDTIDRELFAPDPKQASSATAGSESKGTATPAVIQDEMNEAARRIRETDTGSATQQLQRRIVAQLEELPRQAGQKQSDSASQSANTGGQKAKPGSRSQPDAGAKTAPAKLGSRPGQAPSETKAAEGGQSGLGGKMSLVRRVWGDLPERQRKEILELQPPEEFLPQYETQIEAYFRRLAESKGQ